MNIVGSHITRTYYESVAEVMSVPGSGAGSKRQLVGIRTRKEISEDSLSFYSLSPDYCLPDQDLGALGTRGR